MQIVLITRENSERVTHVSVNLWSNYNEAVKLCYFVNNISLAGENKLTARIISANTEYSLEKYQPFKFDDLVKVYRFTIQRLMREVDSTELAFALKDAKKEVQDVFFSNMSQRAGSMLKEDIEYMEPISESAIENARKLILNKYSCLPPKESRSDEMLADYKNNKKNNTKNQAVFDYMNIILVFRNGGTAADRLSVFLFDDCEKANNFCDYINNLTPDKDTFFYARHVDEMIEYETTKPLLISFDQIFELGRLYGEIPGARIIREALKKCHPDTVLAALIGMDKRSRMLIMRCLPVKTTDEINERIEQSNDLFFLSDSRKAQERIINAINKTVDKFKPDKIFDIEILKD